MKHCDKCGVYYRAEHECAVTGERITGVLDMTDEFDPVQRPAHYNQGGIECIDAIRAALGDDGFRAYCLGNVIKYSWRHAHKNGSQDRQKCAWYARMASGDDPRAI